MNRIKFKSSETFYYLSPWWCRCRCRYHCTTYLIGAANRRQRSMYVQFSLFFFNVTISAQNFKYESLALDCNANAESPFAVSYFNIKMLRLRLKEDTVYLLNVIRNEDILPYYRKIGNSLCTGNWVQFLVSCLPHFLMCFSYMWKILWFFFLNVFSLFIIVSLSENHFLVLEQWTMSYGPRSKTWAINKILSNHEYKWKIQP